MDTTIFAKSSSQPDSPYSVHFIINDETLFIHCSCPAGIYGKLCKHKTSFIKGDLSMLHDPSQQDLLADVLSTIKNSPMYNDYIKFLERKIKIEKDIQELKNELKELKSIFALKLKNGIKLKS
jgi:hypothetical protein